MDFIVFEDGSGQLKINENVTLEFEASSFNFSDFVEPIQQGKWYSCHNQPMDIHQSK